MSYWKVSLYYAFIDHMIMELESRLIKSENRFYAQYLLPRVIGKIATLYETYETDLTCNLDEFKRGGSLDGEHAGVEHLAIRCQLHFVILDAVNPVLYPSIYTI